MLDLEAADEMDFAPFIMLVLVVMGVILLVHLLGKSFTENFGEEETSSAIEKQITTALSPPPPTPPVVPIMEPTVTATPIPMEQVDGLEDSLDDLLNHTHDELTDTQKDMIQKQMEPVFNELDERLDVSDKTRAGIIAVIKDTIPKFVRKYIAEENKKQHDAIIKHVAQTVSNMNAATTAGLNAVKDRMETHIRDKAYEIEDRVARNTETQIRAALKSSKALTENFKI